MGRSVIPLPDGNRTTDVEIARIADVEDRVGRYQGSRHSAGAALAITLGQPVNLSVIRDGLPVSPGWC